MNDFLHIHLPCSDRDIKLLEDLLEVKFVRVKEKSIPQEKVKVCPLSPPSNKIEFLNLIDDSKL